MRRRTIATAVLVTMGTGACCAATWWWALLPGPTVSTPDAPLIRRSVATGPAIDPARWQGPLWRPLRPVAEAPPAPPSIRLVAILQRNGAAAAALARDEQAIDLHYVAAGEAWEGLQVTAIHRDRIEALWQGQRLELALQP